MILILILIWNGNPDVLTFVDNLAFSTLLYTKIHRIAPIHMYPIHTCITPHRQAEFINTSINIYEERRN